VLHLIRYRRDDLDTLLAQIQGTGYGLTLGLHTRIDETIAKVTQTARVGNLYVNRNMVGAVVGVQPFGGEGLSGTGPKAGGPLYLHRLLAARPHDALRQVCRNAVAAQASTHAVALDALLHWMRSQDPVCAADCQRMVAQAYTGGELELPGPTGERNVYRLAPRSRVLCLARMPQDLLRQLTAVLSVGASAVWPMTAQETHAALPDAVREHVVLAGDWTSPEVAFDLVLLHGDATRLADVQTQLARRPGAIVSVECLPDGASAVPFERLFHERSISINTAAAGGNASLMMIA